MSERINVGSPQEINDNYTLLDVADAHALLDMLERLDARAQEPQS